MLATLLAGILDLTGAIIVYVFLLNAVKIVHLLQSIAGGMMGDSVYDGGIHSALAGVALHFFIAFCWSLAYQLIYPSFNRLIKNDLAKGVMYGCVVWMIMNFIVVPNSGLHRAFVFVPGKFMMSIGLIICCIGIPIALITARRSKYLLTPQMR